MLRCVWVGVVVGRRVRGGRGDDRRSTFLLGVTRALDGCSADPSSWYRRVLPVSFPALVFIFFLVFLFLFFLLPGLYLCDTLLLETDCTVAIDRTRITFPTTPLLWDLTLDNIEAGCMAPTRADVAGDAEAIVEKEAADAADSVCVWEGLSY